MTHHNNDPALGREDVQAALWAGETGLLGERGSERLTAQLIVLMDPGIVNEPHQREGVTFALHVGEPLSDFSPPAGRYGGVYNSVWRFSGEYDQGRPVYRRSAS